METQLWLTFKANTANLMIYSENERTELENDETSLPLEGGGMPGEGISSCGNRLKSFNSCDLGSLLVFYAVCVLIFPVQTANIKVLF